MENRAVILVGMMGVGKSTLGQRLATNLGREFLDTDRLLVQRLGRGIPDIFRTYGEPAFRDHENAVLRSLQPGPYVIATGGGIVMREDNWAEIRRLGVSVFLDVPVDPLMARLRQSKKRRPLLETEDPDAKVRELMEVRRPYYERADLHVVLPDGDIEEAAALVQKCLEEAL